MQDAGTRRIASLPADSHLAAIVESSEDAITSKALDGTILSWNAGAERLYGYAAEEAIGRPFSMLVLPEHDGEVDRIVGQLSRGDPIDHFETVRVRKDGTRVFVSVRYSPIRDETGRLIGAAAIARDITEPKRAEQRRNARLAVTEALNYAETIEEAARGVLRAVCENLVWDAGAVWILDAGAAELRCLVTWHSEGLKLERFLTATRQRTFSPGIGLPGRVWTSAQPVWIGDVTLDDNFPRAPIAIQDGLQSAFGFPVQSGSQVLGVTEFFSREIRKPDADLMEMVTTIGGQIGQLIERKRAEEALRESENRFMRFMHHFPGLAWIKGLDGRYVFANDAALKAFQTQVHELYGKTDDEVFDPKTAAQFRENDRQALVSRSGIETIETLEHQDGTLHYSLVSKFPILDQEDKPVLVGGMAIDITRHKRAEQAQRFLAAASESLAAVEEYEVTLQKIASLAVPHFADWCAIDMVEPDGSLRRLAVADPDPAKVKLIFELDQRYPPDPHSPYGRYRVLRTGKSDMMADISDSVLVETTRNDEHLAIVRALGIKSYLSVPLLMRGKILGILSFMLAGSGRRYSAEDLAVAEDLARRAAVAIENAQLYAELKEADRLKDEFLAMLAHELRNPLAPIRNALYIIKQPRVEAEMMAQVREMAERQVQHMAVLLDDLLDVSRVSRGRIDLRQQPVDMADIAKKTVEAVHSILERREHRVTVSFSSESLRVHGDPHRLEQILTNLLNNAAKYTDPGGAIWLTVERENEQVVVRVRDTGIGIAPEMLPRIFDLFVQVERRLDRSQGGVGIGLTLVRKLVELHGGKVEAHSEGLGQGSEFVVRLPALRDEIVRQEAAMTDGDQFSPNLSSHRVLVVDDNQDAATSLAMLLSLSGQEVRTANDGPSGLAAAKAWRPDVVLLDIGMPGMDGYEVARWLRQEACGKEALLVAVTGWGQEEDRKRSQEAGFDHHLTKPVQLSDLEKLLGNARVSRRAADG